MSQIPEVRREFASEKEWRETTKKDFCEALDALLLKHNAEIGIEIRGDASASLEITLAEYVTVNGDDRYLYQSVNLGSSVWAGGVW